MTVPSRCTPLRKPAECDPAVRQLLSSLLAIVAILLSAAFLYVSFVPLVFAVPDYPERLCQFITSFPMSWGGTFDATINLLALMPLGFCWSGALDCRGSAAAAANTGTAAPRVRASRLPRQTFGRVALGSLALAAIAETVQVWLPLRVPSLRDFVALEMGAVAGCGLWWLLGARTTQLGCRALRFAVGSGRRPRALGWLQLFGCLLAICLALNWWAGPSQFFQMYRHRSVRAASFASAATRPDVLLTSTLTALVLSGLCAVGVRALDRPRRLPAGGLRIFMPEASSPAVWSVGAPQRTQEAAVDATGKRAA